MNTPGTGTNNSNAFGRWQFDAETGDLFDGTNTLRLEPQVARLLDFFLSHQDILITRDELIASVWNHRVVSDHAINRCISILRSTLSPDDRNALIETVVRRGFISHFPPPPEPASVARPPNRSKRLRIAAALGLWTVLVLLVSWRMFSELDDLRSDADRIEAPMVAVLPFLSNDLSGDSMFFADGMHDDLLTQLAQFQSLRVISRTSVSEYRDRPMNIREIGRQLGADAILEGGVQRIGDQIRVNAQLIDVHSDTHLWAQQYDRELTPANIFDIQAEIARSIASALRSTLTAEEAARLDVIPTQNMAAYRAYHEAMELRFSETIGSPAYIEMLERAVSLDPDFVRAWAELAGSLSFANLRDRDAQSMHRLEGILERIRSLAPDSFEHLIAQSYYTYYVVKDFDRASELIRKAQALRPGDVQVLELRTWIQRRQGDFEGIADTLREIRVLDPRTPYWTTRLAWSLLVLHRYEEAIRVIEAAPVDSFPLAMLHALLRVQAHREPHRLLEDMKALELEYGDESRPVRLWEAYIAARDYDGAAKLLDENRAAGHTDESWSFSSFPGMQLARVMTDQLGNRAVVPHPMLAEIRAGLEQAQKSGFDGFPANFYLTMAMVSAAEGDTEETERLVRNWFREVPEDKAEWVNLRHYACRVLGMAKAVSAAVECVRSGLVEPSLVMPFIEPFLPYYDGIRADPRFVELLADLRHGGKHQR